MCANFSSQAGKECSKKIQKQIHGWNMCPFFNVLGGLGNSIWPSIPSSQFIERFSSEMNHYPNVSIEVYVCYGIVNFFVIQAFLTLSHSWYLRCSLLTTFRMSHQQSHNRPHATIILHSRPSLSQRGMKGSSSTIDQLIPGLTKHC